jgi:hypothetical protein
VSDRTLRLHLANPTGASGQLGQYPFVTLTTLFVLGVYKYMVVGFWGLFLVI